MSVKQIAAGTADVRAATVDTAAAVDRGLRNGIAIENLTKTYGKVVALKDVSLTVGSGEVVGLLGPNGAGKSTLMKTVVGILRPTSGKVVVAGKDLAEDPDSAKRSVGYLPENPSLYTGLKVREFLSFVGKIRDVADEALASRISDALRTFSLEEKTDALIGTLSKGMKQKVALIASGLHEPHVLVLDEPLTALDPRTQLFVNGWIGSQSKKGTTVLLSTHNLEIAQAYATKIAIIDRGSIIALGDLQNLRKLADAGEDARLDEVFLKLTADGE
jgi:ABC-type multidrug transport system ATPase subunit